MKDLTFQEWFGLYNPEENLIDEHARFQGILFATQGSELAYISEAHPKRIWTYREDHHGNKIIVKGFLMDGAKGFFLCDRLDGGEEIITVHNVEEYH
jgi:hypothetical protein